MRTCKGMDCEGEIMMIQRLRWLWRHPEDTKKHSSPSWILYESLRRIFFGVWFLLPPPKKQIFSNLDLREFVLLFLFKILFGVSAGREAIWYRQIVFFLSALCHLPFSRSFFQGPYSSMRCFSFPFLFFFWVCHLAIFSFFLVHSLSGFHVTCEEICSSRKKLAFVLFSRLVFLFALPLHAPFFLTCLVFVFFSC